MVVALEIPETAVGLSLVVAVPSPIWPYWLAPQHLTVLLSSKTQECRLKVVMAVTPEMSVILIGVVLESPQHLIVLSDIRAQVFFPPTATAVR